MAKIGRAGTDTSMRGLNALARVAVGGAFVLLAASVAACTTGSVLSLEPAVDVGSADRCRPTQPAPVRPCHPTLGSRRSPSDPFLVGYPADGCARAAVRPTCLPRRSTAAGS